MKRGEERAWEFVLTGGGIHALLCAAHIDPLGSLYLGDVFRTTNNGFILKEKKDPVISHLLHRDVLTFSALC